MRVLSGLSGDNKEKLAQLGLTADSAQQPYFPPFMRFDL